jgi:hypothetical protein
VAAAIRTILLKDPSGAERLIPFDQPVLTVGREKHCTIRIDSQYVSRQHARIEQREDSAVLVDLGSHNGSLLNGERIQGSAPIVPGDVVAIADATLEFLAEAGLDGATRTFALRQAPPPDVLALDSQTYEVSIGGKKLDRRLSAQEFELLSYLYQHRERVCQRQELGDAIWGAGNWDPNMLHRLVHRLKDKLEPAPDKPRYIQTVPWVGYRLTE